MAQNVTQRFPFSNKGVVQKIDINQLQDGQYSFLLNTVSEQEGSLSPRYGSRNLPGEWKASNGSTTVATPSVINTLHVTQIGATADPTIYAVGGVNIFRKDGELSNYRKVADSITGDGKRIGMSTYKTDQASTSGVTYIGTGYNTHTYGGSSYFRGMLRDSGKTGEDSYYWGILPPAAPAIATPGSVVTKSVIVDGATSYTGDPGSGSPVTLTVNNTRVTGNITSATEQPAGSKFYKIVLNPVSTEWLPGMYVRDNSGQASIIEKVDSTGAIYAYFDTPPSLSITALASGTATGAAGLMYTATSGSITADLGFGGTDAEGYITDDTVGFSFYTSTPEKIYDIRLRLYAGSSPNSYYEKAISPGPVQDLQNAATGNSFQNPENADTQALDNGTSDAVGATNIPLPTGENINYDPIQTGLTPTYLAPMKRGVGGWSQVEISKRSFIAVGQSATNDGGGAGNLSWATITKVEVLVRPVTTTDIVVFKLGAVFAYGGKGVNSNYSAKLTPYTYVYTYKNPTTGAESNPSIEMIAENGINIVRQGIGVTVLGITNGGFDTGVSQICIYRQGGSFTDGFYRRVGVINNPGATLTTFMDTADDLSIIGAPIADFDNDAPVTSDLGFEYKGTIATSNISKGSNPVTVNVTGVSYPSGGDLRIILTPGTIVNIGGGIATATGKQETCIVASVGASSFTTYVQYDHLVGESIIWDTNAGIAGDILCSAFNRMWVAGDPNNRHLLYSSKTGRPESFPVINQGTGNPHVLAVSSPDNPINGIAEFNGEIVCLCQNGIYTVRLDNGRLVGPFKTPANRGLVLKYAWGYVDNEIWFLGNDGIYSWAGGAVRKVSFAIDFVFNKKTVNGIAYFDRGNSTYYPMCNIQQKGNEVFFNYINSDGWFYILRYHILFDRWSVDEVYDPASDISKTENAIPLRAVSVTAIFSEKASNKLYAAKTIGVTTAGPPPSTAYTASLIEYDVIGIHRDAVTNIADPYASGTSVYYEIKTKFYDMGASLVKKNFTDIGFEYTSGSIDSNGDPENDNTFNYKLYYDYSSTADALDANAIPSTPASRNIEEFPLQQVGATPSSAGKEARAVMLSLWGVSKAYNTFHNFAFTFIPLSEIIKGRVTDWDDLGHPFDKRLFNVTIEYDNGNKDLVLYLDTVSGVNSCTTTLGVQTITLPAKSGRAKTSVPINADVIAKLVRIRPKVSSTEYQIFNYSFQQDNYPRDIINTTDWSDQGYQYEKRFYQLYINCDTNGYDVSVAIEADGGASPLQTVVVNGTSSDRMQPIALNKDLIGKLIRLKVAAIPAVTSIVVNSNTATVTTTSSHGLSTGDSVAIFGCTTDVDLNGTYTVTVTGTTTFTVTVANVTAGTYNTTNNPSLGINSKFQLFDYRFEYENLPKPIILSTPWTDFGYDYMKYAEQIAFDVNTNGYQIPVDIYCDGTWKQRVVVEGTQQARNFNCTLNPAITFQTMRLQVNPDQIPSGGRFQLWEYKPVFRPADKGPVYHTFDWDNLDHPYDKKISEVTIEFETNGKDVVVVLDTITGINGNTENLAVQSFTLNSTGRGYKTFPVPETICKMVRIRALSTAGRANRLDPDFKMWGYRFGNTVPYPPDIQRFSEWTDLDYPCDKIFRGVGLTIDTGGVNCTVVLEVDGVARQTFTVNTTSAARQTFLTAQNSTEIIGKMYRLTFTPGLGGKAQVFSAPQFNTVKDSCPFVFLDSYEQGLGSAGYSVLKQFWADYKCDGSITIKFYNEQNVLFYSKTLGPHASRDVERFYLPSINNGVINKSKKHRITIEAVDPALPFKWYRDTSRLEYINLSADQRQGYYQFIPWTNMQLPV